MSKSPNKFDTEATARASVPIVREVLSAVTAGTTEKLIKGVRLLTGFEERQKAEKLRILLENLIDESITEADFQNFCAEAGENSLNLADCMQQAIQQSVSPAQLILMTRIIRLMVRGKILPLGVKEFMNTVSQMRAEDMLALRYFHNAIEIAVRTYVMGDDIEEKTIKWKTYRVEAVIRNSNRIFQRKIRELRERGFEEKYPWFLSSSLYTAVKDTQRLGLVMTSNYTHSDSGEMATFLELTEYGLRFCQLVNIRSFYYFDNL